MTQYKLTKKDRPVPIENEILIPEHDEIISKTDPKGIIIEANEVFARISGYKVNELLGASHNVIRHPDMPKIMFKILWDRIKDKENIMAVVKNLAKDGSYYWVITDFVTTVDQNRNVLYYSAYRKPINQKVKDAVIPLYKALCALEDLGGIELSESFFNDYFHRLGMTYDEMIEEIMIKNCDRAALLGISKEKDKEKNQSLFEKFFGIKV